MEKQTHKLGDAIRQHYEVTPLKTDLTNAVTNRIFAKEQQPSLPNDRWLVVFGVIGLLAVVVYGITLVSTTQLSSLLVIVVMVAMLGLTARREYLALEKITRSQANSFLDHRSPNH